MSASPLAAWQGPLGGVPPFEDASPSSIEASYCVAVGEMRAAVQAIAANPDPADFANTIVALEEAGRPLARVECLFRAFTSCRNDEAMRAVQMRLVPLRPALDDEIAHNDLLFARICTVVGNPDLSGIERRLAEVVHGRLTRRGGGLDPKNRARLAAINARLAVLQAKFIQHVMLDQDQDVVAVATEAERAGLDPATKAITNSYASVTVALTDARDRGLRERVWRMWKDRGTRHNPPVIAEMLALRGEKAALLGHGSYAAFALTDRMAGTPERALALIMRLYQGALSGARKQDDGLQALAAADDINGALKPWDRAYYAEKLRRERYGFDESVLKPYLSLGGMLKAAFWVASELYGLTFDERFDLPRLDPAVRTFEVKRNGWPLGALWLDPFARNGKNGGAWMDEYRAAESFRGAVQPLVSVNLNLTPPPRPGDPVLMSWEWAQVLFHETGHALHALLSEVTYPSFGILHVPWDWIELPSQIYERWIEHPELLQRFARHHETGEPLPPALFARMKAARAQDVTKTLEVMSSAIVDMRLHLLADGNPVDPNAAERDILVEIALPADIEPRHRVAHFTHVFGRDNYASGYYGYAWADTMVADTAEIFGAAPGGLMDRPTAERFRQSVLSTGNSIPAEAAFRNFAGRDPDPDALLRWLEFT